MSRIVWFLEPSRGEFAASAIRILAGLYVLAAAIAKTHPLTIGLPLDLPDGWPAWTGLLLIEAELLFAMVLLADFFPRTLHWLGSAVFLVFAGYAFSRLLSGAASCGCFGMLHVHPWFTFVMDLVFAVAWSWVSVTRRFRAPAQTGRRCAATASCCLIAIILPLPILVKSTPATFTDDGQLVGDSKVIGFDAESWIGRPLPLLPHMDIGPQLREGRWRVVFHRHGCEECQRLLANLEIELVESAASNSKGVALIEVPPFEQVPSHDSPLDSYGLQVGHLSDQWQWLVETPLSIELCDGNVVAIHEAKTLVHESRGISTIAMSESWRQP